MSNSSAANNNTLVSWSIDHSNLLFTLIGIVTLIALVALPFATVDTNPKNMLPPDSEVRSWNREVDDTFDLYQDSIVVGIRNNTGILNSETLNKIISLTNAIKRISGVAERDVTSLSTVDNITGENGDLQIKPLLNSYNISSPDANELEKAIFESNLFVDRIISQDSKTTAIYVPLEQRANGKEIADAIKKIVSTFQGNENYYITGDPVARDTFGAQMFKLMAYFSPIAGGIMCMMLFFMFRRWSLVMAMMAVSMVSIIWSLSALIAFGYPIHIMSSMAPVFLMAIATDSIHIFNEFYFRCNENTDRRSIVIQTMDVVARPVKYTALATAAGFAVLMLMEIVPVKVFGGMIVFGTLVLRLLSFSLIPVILMKIPFATNEKGKMQQHQEPSALLTKLASFGVSKPYVVGALSILLFSLAGWGVSRIVVDNNQIEWFTPGSDIRIADNVLNNSLGGTALGYIVVESNSPDGIKSPEILQYLDKLQRHIEKIDVVGKTFYVGDYIKRIHQVLHNNNPQFYTIPKDQDTIGQYMFLFSMAARPTDLNNVVDYPFQRANMWVYLKTWDANAMQKVVEAVADYKQLNPIDLKLNPAGTAYFNVVWNNEVLWDMVKGFSLALLIVFVILVMNFRSWRWAIISYVPLAFTIVLIYGVIGWIGKDFDMPISVLSCLSLGMAVDFAIHFISRFQQRFDKLQAENNEYTKLQIKEALMWTAGRPGKGIFRNAILFATAFSVMMAAPLTPYITVGVFIVSMMLLSAISVVVMLPALIMLTHKLLILDRSPNTSTQLKECV